MTGFVGESGSGKSTLGLALLGHFRAGLVPVRGRVWCDGSDLLPLTADERLEIRRKLCAYVPQNPGASLNPNLRIVVAARHALASAGLYVRDQFKARLEEVAATVGLPTGDEFWHRYPEQLSGGQQQRVVLALGLLRRARYVVFDEPTTGLDVIVQEKVLTTIREVMQANDMAGIFISHDLAVVRQVADDVVILYSGEVVEIGPVAEVIGQPQHPYAQALIASVVSADVARSVVGIPGVPLLPTVGVASCRFIDRCKFARPICQEGHPELRRLEEGRFLRCRVNSADRTEIFLQEAPPILRPNALEGSPRRDAALEISGLVVQLQGKTIVNDVSLSVGTGQTLAIVGESGAGKTTLSRCLAGLIAARSGEAQLFGEPLRLDGVKKPRRIEQLRQVQYVFQNPYTSLNPRHNVGQTLSIPLARLSGVKRGDELDSRLVDLLTAVALDESYLTKFPNELSGGERQRVCIARALAGNPSLVICDEPTSALDVSVQASILRLLSRLREERNLTLIMVTHDLGIVRMMADLVLVMRDGVVVDKGTVDEVFARSDGYSAELRRAVPSIDEKAAGVSRSQMEARYAVE
jgi:peptide/nickel transport system ATP-binding protein